MNDKTGLNLTESEESFDIDLALMYRSPVTLVIFCCLKIHSNTLNFITIVFFPNSKKAF
jgi:hypothetical protein